jgi:hypothetical protein
MTSFIELPLVNGGLITINLDKVSSFSPDCSNADNTLLNTNDTGYDINLPYENVQEKINICLHASKGVMMHRRG